MKIILLNGPPSAGKDTAARWIRKTYIHEWSFRWEKFSLPHKVAFAAMMNARIDTEGNVEWYEHRKGEIIDALGVSYRQWQIDFSEKFMKPLYGKDIFTKLFLKRNQSRLHTDRYLCVVSDCGFQTEADGVIAAMPPTDVMLVRIHRTNDGAEGYGFEGDSREWVHGYKSGIYEHDVVNETGDPTVLEAQLRTIVGNFLSEGPRT